MMKVEVESLKGHYKKLNIEVAAQTVGRHLDAYSKEVQENVTLKGFRKGKAPITMVKQLYADGALNRVTKNIVEENLRQALRDQSLTPVGSPEIDVQVVLEGAPLKFTATFESLPPIELKKYLGLQLAVTDIVPTADEIFKTIENIRGQMAATHDALEGTQAAAGLLAVLDYKATHNGEPFAPATEEDSLMELGNGSLFDGFEKNVYGMKAGDTKSFEVNFPEAAKEEEPTPVAGKTIHFEVKVKGLKTKELPELNDDFAKKLGPFQSFDDLKKRVTDDIKRQKNEKQTRDLQDKVLDWLIEENPVDAPETMVNSQMQQLAVDAGMQLSQMGLDQTAIEAKLKTWGDDIFQKANRQVRASLLLGAIAKKENIQANEEELRQEVVRMAMQSKRSPKEVLDDLQKQGLLSGLYRQLTELKALSWVMNKATARADG